MIKQVNLHYRTNDGRLRYEPGLIEIADGRIFFLKSPFKCKDDIKAMKGSKWHGFDEKNPRKIWSVADCTRNRINLAYMMNLDPLGPWFFDREIEKHEYTRPLMPHQCDLTDAALTYHYQIFAAEMGTGKGGLPSTRVATPAGWTTLGEIRVGDRVINPEGGTTRVKGVYRRGKMEMFRVTFSDGSSTVCSGDHLWSVRTACRKHRGMPYETLELREIISRGLHMTNGNAKHYIPMVKPVEYVGGTLPISPYLAGYILGNGGLSGFTNIISIPDRETVDRLNSMVDHPLQLKAGSEYDYHIKDEKTQTWIKSTGLRGCRSHEKHLPDQYLYAPVVRRIELLQGLCDADGHPGDKGGAEYSTTSPRLRDAFVMLVQSLGGTCHVAETYPSYTHNGERRKGRLAYRIYVSLPSDIRPFRLGRKAERYVTPTKYQPTRAIVDVESIGEDECICIAVEADNQLYVTDAYIVTHNTLSAQEVIERSNASDWYWIGPKTSIPNIKREFRKWNFPFDQFNVEFMTYEGLVRRMDEWKPGEFVPHGVIFDESSRLKTPTAQRTKAAQMLADLIREQHDKAGYVILMSGTPSPKTPLDWWSQVEITYPGYLKEGSIKALEQRLAFMVRQEFDSGVSFNKRTGWKDNEQKCAVCGGWPDDDCHTEMAEEYHRYKPSENEVAFMYERLQGLVIIKHKKDCLSLPEKRYRRIYCKPAASILRVAQAIVQSAPNTVTGLTLLRELSDGFQYREVQDGMTRCTHCTDGKVAEWVDPERPDQTYEAVDMLDPEVVGRLVKRETDCPLCGGSCEVPKYVRETRQVPCPKDAALKLLLEENEEVGRIVIFAGFTGSVDRVQKLCQSQGWDVVRCDGRGFLTFTHDDAQITEEEPLDYWGNLEAHPRVAFVAHPESGGMSLTLTEARMAVYWSNSWKPEYRIQSEDRIHRKGMDENLGCTIVDLIHLPSDERVLEVIRENRRLELMSMGTVMDGVNWDEPRGADDGVEIVES